MRDVPSPTPTPDDRPPLTPTWTPLPYAFIDASPVMAGICFDSADDAAGRVFVLRSPAELTDLFNQADNSGFCTRPVVRGTFDFAPEGGEPSRAIAGLWSRAQGCSANHEVLGVDVNETERIFSVRVRLVVGGTCDYALVRPFWIGISGYNQYDIRLLVESSPEE
ncbi:MAG: hypothetical protein KME04_12120 [Pleurocapsa minor GSE-CHR-MK-17-07R]|nr:hypothetical protein [Pleurocapsa minor GSE-CHR-MK 17-07R]